MSLQEFFSDESYGGSWADEEIDMASISVPIEKNRGYSHGGDNRYGGGFGASRGGFGRPVDNGPPYIVKLSNIPLTSDDGFIEDLFQSRFTPLVKFKIIFDPASHPFESGIVKKIAFVELRSFADQSKVSRWQDVVFKGTRRVNIELADFHDFQFCMSFNQENHQRLLDVEREFMASRPRLGSFEERPLGGNRFHGSGRAPGGMPLDDVSLNSNRRADAKVPDSGLNRSGSTNNSVSQMPTNRTVQARPKSNPFGNAKPVDVIAKEHEMESTYVHEHHSLPSSFRRKSSSSSSQRPNFHDIHKNEANHNTGATNSDNSHVPKSGDENVTKKQTFADVLSTRKEAEPLKPNGKSSGSASSTIRKPVILKKKPVSSSEGEAKKEEAAPTPSKQTETADSKIAESLQESEKKQNITDISEKEVEQANSTTSKAQRKQRSSDSLRKEGANTQQKATITAVSDTTQGKGSRRHKQRAKKDSTSGSTSSQNSDLATSGPRNGKKMNRESKDTKGELKNQNDVPIEKADADSKESTGRKSSSRRRSNRNKDETQSARVSSKPNASKPLAEGGSDNKSAEQSDSTSSKERSTSSRRSDRRRGRGGSKGGSKAGAGDSKGETKNISANPA